MAKKIGKGYQGRGPLKPFMLGRNGFYYKSHHPHYNYKQRRARSEAHWNFVRMVGWKKEYWF